MRSTYPTRRSRRRSRRRLGCVVLIVGAIVLLAVVGTRTARNWGVPSFGPRPTPTATALPPVPAGQENPAARAVVNTQPPTLPADPYREWIHEARDMYPYADSEERMVAVMLCESGGDPAIVSPDGVNHGLFQYNAATWAGDWNPYRDQPIYDARAQIFATACAWSLGMQGQWGCYTNPLR
jgi:hypothetical protein